MLHHHPLLHKDGIRVRGVKVVGRDEINPFLRGEIKAVLPGPLSLNLRLKQIFALRAAAQSERVDILRDIHIKRVQRHRRTNAVAAETEVAKPLSALHLGNQRHMGFRPPRGVEHRARRHEAVRDP